MNLLALALLRSRGEESGPLLLDFGATALWALDVALIVFSNR
jgi:hypothetical protein